jgi:hypothetical protein
MEIFMKNSFKAFLLSGIPFGITMGLYWGAQSNFFIGIISGIFMGFLFGLLISGFVYIQSKNFKKNSKDIVGDKDIIMEGAANHFCGMESVGGWLYLTREEIIFKSHNVNIQRHEIRVPLNEVKEIKTSLSLGIVPNGIQINTQNKLEKFVVNNRKVWVQKINETISYR